MVPYGTRQPDQDIDDIVDGDVNMTCQPAGSTVLFLSLCQGSLPPPHQP